MGGYEVINRVRKTGLMIRYRLPHDLANVSTNTFFQQLWLALDLQTSDVPRAPTRPAAKTARFDKEKSSLTATTIFTRTEFKGQFREDSAEIPGAE